MSTFALVRSSEQSPIGAINPDEYGSFSSATNPSGELIGRIRDARRAVTSKTFNTNARLAEDIELFISNSQVVW